MPLYTFRGHASGLDLGATVRRFPALAGRPGAEEALAAALDAEGERLARTHRERIHALVAEWAGLVAARAPDPRLAALPAELAEAAALVPDAAQLIRQLAPPPPRLLRLLRLPVRGPDREALDGLARALERRLDPQLARHLGRDAVLAAVVARAAAALEGAGGPPRATSPR